MQSLLLLKHVEVCGSFALLADLRLSLLCQPSLSLCLTFQILNLSLPLEKSHSLLSLVLSFEHGIEAFGFISCHTVRNISGCTILAPITYSHVGQFMWWDRIVVF